MMLAAPKHKSSAKVSSWSSLSSQNPLKYLAMFLALTIDPPNEFTLTATATGGVSNLFLKISLRLTKLCSGSGVPSIRDLSIQAQVVCSLHPPMLNYNESKLNQT